MVNNIFVWVSKIEKDRKIVGYQTNQGRRRWVNKQKRVSCVIDSYLNDWIGRDGVRVAVVVLFWVS